MQALVIQEESTLSFRKFFMFINGIIAIGCIAIFVHGFIKDYEQPFYNYSFIGGELSAIAALFFFYASLGIYGAAAYNPTYIRAYLLSALASIGVRILSVAAHAWNGLLVRYYSYIYLVGECFLILITLPVLAKAERRSKGIV